MLQNKTTAGYLRVQNRKNPKKCSWRKGDGAKRWHKRRIGVGVCLGIVVLCVFLFWAEAKIRPVLRAIIDYESCAYAVTSFQEAVQAHLAQNPDVYRNLYTVTWDADSVPTSVVGNGYELNLVRSELAQLVLAKLVENKADIYQFRLGRLSGVQALATRGPYVTLEMNPESYVITQITQTLESAGENQTLLSVYATFTVQINVSMAGYLQTVTVENEVLLWQNLLIGRVPDVNV